MVDLAAHKSPAWSILQIGGTEFLTRSLLQVLGAEQDGSPVRFGSYTIAHPDTAWLEKAEGWLPEAKTGMKLNFQQTDLSPETIKSEAYDLVIIGGAPEGIDIKLDVVNMAQAALKEGGTAIFGGSDYVSDTSYVHSHIIRTSY